MSNPNALFEDPKLKSAANSRRAARILAEGHNTSVELEKVVRELNVSLQLVPSNIESHMDLAETYCRAYDWSSAVFSLRFVLHANPKHERALLRLRDMYCLMGKEMVLLALYEEAVAHFKNALKYDPAFVEAWTLMAKCFVYIGDFKSAIEAAGRSVALAGATNAELYIFRAKLYWAMGLEAPGNADMRRALDMNKDHPEVLNFLDRSFMRAEMLYNRGMGLLDDGDNMGALACMEQALSLSREDIKLYLTIAKIYRLVGDLDKALFTLQDAAAIYKTRFDEDNFVDEEDSLDGSDSSESENAEKDDNSRSINDNDSKYLASKPTLPEIPPIILTQINLIYNDMALKFANEGQYPRAITLLHKVITSERERAAYQGGGDLIDYRYFMNRGDCYRAQGENFYASADYHSALEINPGAWEIRTKLSLIHYQTAVNYFNSSTFAAAANELNEAIRLNNRVCEYYLLRGRTNYYQGYYHDACEDFKCAKQLDPDNPGVLEYTSLFGHGIIEEIEGKDIYRIRGSQSAAVLLRPVKTNKVLPKSESLDRLRRSYKENKNLLKRNKSSCAIVRNIPKEAAETEPVGISTFFKILPPLHQGYSTGLSNSAPTSKKRLIAGSHRPLIPSEMLDALHAATHASQESFNKVMSCQVDFISKDPTWSLIETAKRDADALLNAETKKTREDERRKDKARKQGAVTVTSLKRRSIEATRLSLENKTAVLAGVISRHDDPELLALATMNEMNRKMKHYRNKNSTTGRKRDSTSSAAGDDSLCASSLSSNAN